MTTKTLQRRKSKSKFQAIPSRKAADHVTDAIAENIEILTGQRGEGGKKAVLWEDLEDLNFATMDAKGRVKSTLPPPSSGGASSGGGGATTPPTAEAPTAPQTFVVVSGFGVATLSWDTPTYAGHAYAQVWQNTVDNFQTAKNIDSTTANIRSYSIPQDGDFYYWVNFVNIKGDRGPLADAAGRHAKSTVDPDFFLDLIGEKINKDPDSFYESIQLDGFVKGAIDLTSYFETQSADELDRIIGEAALENALTVNRETKERRTETGLLRSTLETYYYTKIENDRAMTALGETLTSTISGVNEQISATLKNNYQTTTETNQAISQATQSLESKISGVDNEVTQVSATLKNNYQTATETNTAIGQATQSIKSSINGIESTVNSISQTLGTLDGDYKALWGVKLSANDVSASIGLVAESNTNTGVSDATFTVKNAQFQVIYEDEGTKRSVPVFGTIRNPAWDEWNQGGQQGPQPVKNILSIDTTSIKVASIKDLVAGKIVADSIIANSEINSPILRTPQINDAQSNFYVSQNGLMKTKNADVQGKITAASGELNNVTIKDTCTIEGTLKVQQIIGDVVKVYPFETQDILDFSGYRDAYTITIPAADFDRIVVWGGAMVNSFTCFIDYILNGQSVKRLIYSNGVAVGETASWVGRLSAGRQHVVKLRVTKNTGERLNSVSIGRGAGVVMAFKA